MKVENKEGPKLTLEEHRLKETQERSDIHQGK
jgi:hypothetical protein